jgi:hypothetical protein
MNHKLLLLTLAFSLVLALPAPAEPFTAHFFQVEGFTGSELGDLEEQGDLNAAEKKYEKALLKIQKTLDKSSPNLKKDLKSAFKIIKQVEKTAGAPTDDLESDWSAILRLLLQDLQGESLDQVDQAFAALEGKPEKTVNKVQNLLDKGQLKMILADEEDTFSARAKGLVKGNNLIAKGLKVALK